MPATAHRRTAFPSLHMPTSGSRPQFAQETFEETGSVRGCDLSKDVQLIVADDDFKSSPSDSGPVLVTTAPAGLKRGVGFELMGR